VLLIGRGLRQSALKQALCWLLHQGVCPTLPNIRITAKHCRILSATLLYEEEPIKMVGAPFYLIETPTSVKKWAPKLGNTTRRFTSALQPPANTGGANTVAPSDETVGRLIERFIKIYGTQNYGLSTYRRQIRLFDNHVIPAFGKMKVQEISPLVIEAFIADLRKKKVGGSMAYNKPEEELPALSIGTIRLIYSAVKVLFRKAVEWEVIAVSPVICKKPAKPKSYMRWKTICAPPPHSGRPRNILIM
jgi:hypothetical protein